MLRSRRRPATRARAAVPRNPLRQASLFLLDTLDWLLYAFIGIAFVGAALLALTFSLAHLVADFGFAPPINGVIDNVLTFVSDLLLVLIIMEVLGTVRSYLEKGDTSVQPFLFIGIISATRGILSLGARLSIQGPLLKPDDFRNTIVELAVDALVIISLGTTIRIMGKAADQPAEEAAVAAPATPPAERAGPPQEDAAAS